MALVLKWLPSLVIFALCFVIGLSLGGVKYALGGATFGVINGVAVAVRPVGRMLWAMTWRVGLALFAIAIAGQIERISQMGLTAFALQRSVDTVYVERPQVMDGGYTVKAATVSHGPIAFDWASEGRKASEAGTGVDGVLASAREQIAVYRDNGVPGWLIDAIDNAPPVVYTLSVALLLLLFGAHALVSWRGIADRPEPVRQIDRLALGGLIVLHGAVLWLNTTDSALWARAVLLALLVIGLGAVALRSVRARQQTAVLGRVSPLDGAFDAFLVALYAATEIRNVRAASRARGRIVAPVRAGSRSRRDDRETAGRDAAARRDHQSAVPPRGYSDPGRAHRRPDAAGKPRTVQDHARAGRAGRVDHFHHAQIERSLRGRDARSS